MYLFAAISTSCSIYFLYKEEIPLIKPKINKIGITGRLNGAGAEAFWGQGGPQAGAHHMHQPKMPMGPGNTSGWEEPSPPSQRRNMPNYDDGTSLWGNPQPGKSQQFIILIHSRFNAKFQGWKTHYNSLLI